jgi:hypothetical protein
MPADHISRLAETAEAEFMYQYETMASSPTQAALGVAAARIGGGVALSMRNDVTDTGVRHSVSGSPNRSPSS